MTVGLGAMLFGTESRPGILDIGSCCEPAILGIGMRDQLPHWFDRPALYAALDAQRRTRGISWQQVSRETGVAASTIVATKRDGLMETDGMLAMVRWLGCAPENFIRGSGRPLAAQPAAESAAPVPKHRFNTTTLYRALDARRRSRNLTWRQVALEIGNNISPAMLTRLAREGALECM